MSLQYQRIDFFEQYIPEEVLLEGEELFDQNSIPDQTSLGPGKWKFQVMDGQVFDVYIKLKNSTIQSFSCSCLKSKNPNVCKHIVASLFALRQIYAEEKKSNKWKKTSKSKMGVRDILNSVPTEELHLFLQNYTRTDKKFLKLLKAKFARNVFDENRPEDYRRFLKSIVGPVTSYSSKFNTNDLRIFLLVTEELMLQYEDSLSMEQYKLSFPILASVLEHVCYIRYHTNLYAERIEKLTLKVHEKYKELLASFAAPELRSTVFEFGLTMFAKSYYECTHSQLNLIEILNQAIQTQDERKKLDQQVLEKLNQYGSDSQEFIYLTGYLLRTKQIRSDSVEKLISKLPSNQKTKLIRHLCTFNDYKTAEKVLKFMLKQTSNDSILENMLLEVYQKSQQKEAYINRAIRVYLKWMNTRVLKQITQIDFKKTGEIEEKILNQFHGTRMRERLLHLYYYSMQREKLLKLIIDLPQIEDVVRYDDILFEDYGNELLNAYKVLLHNHLSRYAGPDSMDKVRKLLSHLRQNDQNQIIHKITKYIAKEFSHRRTIREEFSLYS